MVISPLFSDNMILQRGKPVRVWGQGEGTVNVRFEWDEGGVTASTLAHNGQWSLLLPPLSAGLTGELVINDTVRFRNVITGDVWFAGGQSNMELELVNCKNGTAELASCANPDIRFYQVVKRAVVDNDYLREEAESKWQVCGPDAAAMLSAAAYFFARKINADMGVPIGIINCSWGGTSISTWMSREMLQQSFAGRRYIDDYSAKVGDKTEAQYMAEMEAYLNDWREWDERIQERRKQEPDVSWETLNRECGQCPWPQPSGLTSAYCPANLHTARIRRAAPFTLKGFLYYQGEEDDLRADDYREMMYYLVRQWRSDWQDDGLPFLFVQLPMYASREEVESGNPPKHWCRMRESQYLASADIANSGLAVIIDCGEYDNIHPLDKQTVGFRLALQALRKVYGKIEIEADGPVFSWAKIEDDSLRLYFDHAESGLEFRGSADNVFEIAAADGPYYAANAIIDGSNLIVSADEVPHPCRVRYAWVKYGPTPLYARNGLPAMPFRSHSDE
jgi:sialate O-acetylesterase